MLTTGMAKLILPQMFFIKCHQVKGIPSEDLGLDKNYDCGQCGNKDIEHNNIKLNYACLHILKSSSDLFCKLKKKRFF